MYNNRNDKNYYENIGKIYNGSLCIVRCGTNVSVLTEFERKNLVRKDTNRRHKRKYKQAS